MAGKTYNLPPFMTWDTQTYPVGQAAKIIEEAAEVLDEVAALSRETKDERIPARIFKITYECMDTIQAVCNLMAMLGIDRDEMWHAYHRMMDAQRERGRL